MSSVIPVTCPQTEGLYDAAKLMKKMDKNGYPSPFFLTGTIG
jgi:MinD-like ATPase involved in chromosome partitioning or flagellar assembly